MKSLFDSLTRIVNDEYTVKGLGKKAGNVLALPVKVKQNYKLYALLGYPMTEGNLIRSSRPGAFGKKVVLRNFAKFTCVFPVNFAKFLRTHFFKETSSGCFCLFMVGGLINDLNVQPNKE